MEEYIYEEGTQGKTEEVMEDEEASSPEQAFMKGYHDDENKTECAECGTAVENDEMIVEEIEGEQQTFCSKDCLEEYKDSLGE